MKGSVENKIKHECFNLVGKSQKQNILKQLWRDMLTEQGIKAYPIPLYLILGPEKIL